MSLHTYSQWPLAKLTRDGKLPKLDIRVVHFVVVEEVNEGDRLATVGRPLVQAPRRILLGGAPDQVALEKLDHAVQRGRGEGGAVGAEGGGRDGLLVVVDRHHADKVILLGLRARDLVAELRIHHVEVPDLGDGAARNDELPGGTVGFVLILRAVFRQVGAPDEPLVV